MSDTPFMPLWVADFVGDTLDLDAKEVGAYMLILMTMWGRGGTLPNDAKKLQRVARCGRDWAKVWAAIEHYFTVEGDTISQARLTRELQKVAAKREVNAQSGARGGRAKALKSKEQGLANATVSLKQPEPEYTDTNVSGADAPVDFAKAIFENGVRYLVDHGTSEQSARALVGKWRKTHEDREIFEAFKSAKKAGATDPKSYIAATLGGQHGKSADEANRIQRIVSAAAAGSSNQDWG